jgi:hypothetical protein
LVVGVLLVLRVVRRESPGFGLVGAIAAAEDAIRDVARGWSVMGGFWLPRSDLDGWARALGVTNDGDATARLRVVVRRLDRYADFTHGLVVALGDVPDGNVTLALGRATAAADEALDGLLMVHRGFVVHERGDR